jgi:hypothetical protein
MVRFVPSSIGQSRSAYSLSHPPHLMSTEIHGLPKDHYADYHCGNQSAAVTWLNLFAGKLSYPRKEWPRPTKVQNSAPFIIFQQYSSDTFLPYPCILIHCCSPTITRFSFLMNMQSNLRLLFESFDIRYSQLNIYMSSCASQKMPQIIHILFCFPVQPIAILQSFTLLPRWYT